jgi:hypothetical protein
VEKKKTLTKYKYDIEYNFIDFLKQIIPAKKLPVELYVQINTILKNELKTEAMSYHEINHLFRTYQKEYKYYRFYLKWKKPHKIFFVNNLQKGLIAAAHSLQISAFEVQHCHINYAHMVYSYPDIVVKNDWRIIMPDYILTFADYWGTTGINVPTKLYSIGNNNFVPVIERNSMKDTILFISGVDISQIAIQYAQAHPEVMIRYKLHPNHYSNDNMYKELFKNYANISILKNETPVEILIAQATLVVLVASTVLYEALSLGTKVAIYKITPYETLSSCFSLKNVYLFDTVEELHQAYLADEQPTDVCFFEKFDKVKFNKIIN